MILPSIRWSLLSNSQTETRVAAWRCLKITFWETER